MTDLTKGIIEIEGVQITPDTTLECFERENTANGTVFEKEDIAESVVLFALNGDVYRFPNAEFDTTKHQEIVINGMTFLNVIVLFRNKQVERIELISNLQHYMFDKDGQKTYSPQKEFDCYHKMTEWGQRHFGLPSFDDFYCWNYCWGCLKTSTGSSSYKFFVEYGRNYTL